MPFYRNTDDREKWDWKEGKEKKKIEISGEDEAEKAGMVHEQGGWKSHMIGGWKPVQT